MKALNCANCGANLDYNIGSPVAFCQYCNSVNVLDSIQVKIDNTNPVAVSNSNFPVNTYNSLETPPTFYEELKPRILLPQEKFVANYLERSGNAQGGRLWITDTEIFFKPHSINFGDLSKKYMKISEIATMEKTNELLGLYRILTIRHKKGRAMTLVSWNRNGIISAIENRQMNLV
jgi:hypothetical protein